MNRGLVGLALTLALFETSAASAEQLNQNNQMTSYQFSEKSAYDKFDGCALEFQSALKNDQSSILVISGSIAIINAANKNPIGTISATFHEIESLPKKQTPIAEVYISEAGLLKGKQYQCGSKSVCTNYSFDQMYFFMFDASMGFSLTAIDYDKNEITLNLPTVDSSNASQLNACLNKLAASLELKIVE